MSGIWKPALRVSSIKLLALWIGCGGLLVFWLLDSPLIYWDEGQAPFPKPLLLVLTAFFFALGEPNDLEVNPSTGGWLLGLLLMAEAFFAPDLLWLPLLLAGIVLGLTFSPWRIWKVNRLSSYLLPFSSLALLQGLFLLASPFLFSRIHGIPALAGPLELLGRLGGLPMQASEGFLVFSGRFEAVRVDVSVEKLALIPVALIAIAGAFLLRKGGGKSWQRKLILLVSFLGLMTLLRFLILCAALLGGASIEIFFRGPIFLTSLLILFLATAGFALALCRNGKVLVPQEPQGPVPVLRNRSGAVAGLFALLVLLGLTVKDPGNPKQGRVLVDEGHSEWAKSDLPLDLDRFGTLATYNYYSLVEFLRFYFPQVDRNYLPLTQPLLDEYDVLILKAPTRPFEGEERAEILNFLRRGGGVWLIGDHTNVFGMNSYLNPIANEGGISFGSDSLVDQREGEHQIYIPFHEPLHPTVLSQPAQMLMMTSCSLKVDWSADLSMVSHSTFSDPADYSKLNFFGDFLQQADEPFGMFPQAATASVGRGRLAAFSDSTIFSSFSIFMPGKAELALATLEWLNRENSEARYFCWVGITGLIGLACWTVFVIFKRKAFAGASQWICAGTIGGIILGDTLNRLSYPLPKVRCPMTTVSFDYAFSRYKLPITHETHEWDQNNYHTFFVGVQRIGLVPRVRFDLRETLGDSVLVLVNPVVWMSPFQIASLRSYVGSGGRILVLDDGRGDPGAANLILSPFGLEIDSSKVGTQKQEIHLSSVLSGKELVISSETGRIVRGGETLLTTDSGEPVLAASIFGKGRVAAMTLADCFVVSRLGDPEAVPDEVGRGLLKLEASLFRDVLKIVPAVPCGESQDRGHPLK